MSLTFDFPSWKVRVSTSQSKDASVQQLAYDDTLPVDADWAADLEELDVEDGICTPQDGLVVHDELQQQTDGQLGGEAPSARYPRICPLPVAPAATYGVMEDSGTHSNRRGADVAHSTHSSNGCSALPSPSGLIGGPDTPGFTPGAEAPEQLLTTNCSAAPALAVRGDSIPAEVLLLVLSGLRDVGDCVRAALVCSHWLGAVCLSNDLWYDLDAQHLAGGIWHRPPHAGCPLLRPPPGCDHPRSKMLSYKTTCALSQVAVRIMVLRKGFEYIVEAAGSLWLAASRAAAEAAGGSEQWHPQLRREPDAQSPCSVHLPQSSLPQSPYSARQAACAVNTGRAWSSNYGNEAATAPRLCSGGGDLSSPAAATPGAPQEVVRITHVDQLWETCGRRRAALQVDERFNAVRVQQMVGKLCSSGGSSAAHWLPLYEGVAAVMTSRCDQIRHDLATQASSASAAAAATRGAEAKAGSSTPAAASSREGDSKRRRLAPSDTSAEICSGGGGGGGAMNGRLSMLRGEVVYGGNSYADQFAELLRRGDTRGALALGVTLRRAAAAAQAGDSGENTFGGEEVHWELDEPEMREVLMEEKHEHDGPAGLPAAGSDAFQEGYLALPANVAEGLLLWRLLLRAWPVYRRWLEVWTVWCGPLGARVEAERQLAGAAAAPGEAPLAPPHLTNKGLLLFRSQVLLSYPLRRPLQAAALWLAARATLAEGCRGGGWMVGGCGGGRSECIGLDGGGAHLDVVLSDEHGQLLVGIRKLLTELALPDDVTQPPSMYTRQKLQRCFGGLLLRPVSGGARALQLAQRLQGLRSAAGGSAVGVC